MKRKLFNNKGFTLMEMIVVLVVLAILMCIAAPSVFGYSRKAQETAAIAEAKEVVTAMIDLISEDYKKTGSRITGEECLIKDDEDEYGDSHPMVIEARKLAGIVSKDKGKSDDPNEWHGRVRGRWVRGNEDYILSHLVYEYSKDIWVIYDRGEYKVYKGEEDAEKGDDGRSDEDKHIPPGGIPQNKAEQDAPPTYTPGEGPHHGENLTFPEVVPKETTTETTTESTEATTETTTEKTPEITTVYENKGETLTDSDGNEHTFKDPTGKRWPGIKEASDFWVRDAEGNKIPKYDPNGNVYDYEKNYDEDGTTFKVGYIYEDVSGTYLCIGSQWTAWELPKDKLLADQVANYPSSFVKIVPELRVFTVSDYNKNKSLADSINNNPDFSNFQFSDYEKVMFYSSSQNANVTYNVAYDKLESPTTFNDFVYYNGTKFTVYPSCSTYGTVAVDYDITTGVKSINGSAEQYNEYYKNEDFKQAVDKAFAEKQSEIDSKINDYNTKKKQYDDAKYIIQNFGTEYKFDKLLRGDILYANGKYYMYSPYNETERNKPRVFANIWQGQFKYGYPDVTSQKYPAIHGDFVEMLDFG